MSKDQKEICLYCKWWQMNDCYDREDDDLEIYPVLEHRAGVCRINPPIPVLVPAAPTKGVWPEVWGGDFCGQFQNRPDDHEGPEHISKVAGRVVSKLSVSDGEDAA